MRFRIGSGLPYVTVFSVLLIIVVYFFPVDVLRIVLGLPFLLFFPGYVLILALFPGKSSLGSIERVALSIGSSIAITPLVGLALNYAPWGITLESILYSISAVILATSLVAWIRLKRITEKMRFSPVIEIRKRSIGKTAADKILTVVLVISIIGAVSILGYVIANPKAGEKFTEFYLLGSGGQAADYPREITLDEGGSVIVGVVNHEQERYIYRVKVVFKGQTIGRIDDIILDDEEKFEGKLDFSISTEGIHQRIEFLLLRGDSPQPYLTLHLFVDVVNGD